MTSKLAQQSTKFDKLMCELENNPALKEDLDRARADVKAWFDETTRRQELIEARLRERLVDEFRDNLEIRAPGPLATATAKALVDVVARMLKDPSLYGEVPMSTVAKIEL